MAKKKAKKKSSLSSHHRQPPSPTKVIIGLASPTSHSPAAHPAAMDNPLAQPILTAPPPLSILGNGPIAPVDVQPPRPKLSSADSSCVEDSNDD
ncbi:hypothetical protein OIU78_020275 [Salix suchowensis]|nr:hypothetical protein OIU78_020275 [Salix suchowensis]